MAKRLTDKTVAHPTVLTLRVRTVDLSLKGRGEYLAPFKDRLALFDEGRDAFQVIGGSSATRDGFGFAV